MEILTAHQIEAKAVANGLKVADMCRLAGVSFQKFWSWREKGKKIKLETYEKLFRGAEGVSSV